MYLFLLWCLLLFLYIKIPWQIQGHAELLLYCLIRTLWFELPYLACWSIQNPFQLDSFAHVNLTVPPLSSQILVSSLTMYLKLYEFIFTHRGKIKQNKLLITSRVRGSLHSDVCLGEERIHNCPAGGAWKMCLPSPRRLPWDSLLRNHKLYGQLETEVLQDPLGLESYCAVPSECQKWAWPSCLEAADIRRLF